ncbi:MAG: VanZ family protein [Gemmatimonadetes bacterium]|nr:VanZ family protein [Gemmatimonadota bacterium]
MTARQRYLAARIAYVAIILLATLSQLDVSPDPAAAARRLGRAFTPSIAWRDAIDGLRNTALFAGLGAVWVVTSLTGKVVNEIRLGALVGLSLSVAVEGVQVFSPVRTASIVDVVTNTVGALAGALAAALLIAALQPTREGRSYLGLPAFLLAGPYGLAALCEALTPLFTSETIRGVGGGPLTRLRVSLQLAFPLSLNAVPLTDVLLLAPAAFLAVMALAERGTAAATLWRPVAVVGAGIAFAADVGHGAFGLPVRWEAVLTHVVAVWLGAWAAHRWLAPLTQALRGAARARAAVFAYAGLLVLWAWRPLWPKTSAQLIVAQLTPANLIPLQSLAGRVDVFSALHVAQQFLLYLPLGALLAVWPLRLDGAWSHLRPAFCLAAVLEVGHLVIAYRYFDVTNALLAGAGLAIGWVVVRRSGFKPYGAALPGG